MSILEPDTVIVRKNVHLFQKGFHSRKAIENRSFIFQEKLE